MVKFGREPGLSAIWAQLAVRAESRSRCPGGVRVAEGGGAVVSRPEVSARDEAKNLGLSGVVTGFEQHDLLNDGVTLDLYNRVVDMATGFQGLVEFYAQVGWKRRNLTEVADLRLKSDILV